MITPIIKNKRNEANANNAANINFTEGCVLYKNPYFKSVIIKKLNQNSCQIQMIKQSDQSI